MAKKISDIKDLTKGEIRKLNALRKSVGDDIAEEAFTKWLSQKQQDAPEATDKNAAAIKDALQPLIDKKKLSIPRGGYLVRRGRGRVIIERPASDDKS
ncbi:MAG: hypothetical protein RLT05_29840 [Bauldia litoralis]